MPEHLAGPRVEDAMYSEPVDGSAAHDPTTGSNPVGSPQAQPPEMGFGGPVRPQGGEVQRPSRDIPEVVEEIECEPPSAQDSSPQLVRTFVRRGDSVEVVEDEKASEKVETLKATLASVSSQIHVS